MKNVIQFPSSLDRANRKLEQAFELFNASDDASPEHSVALAEIMQCALNGADQQTVRRAAACLREVMNVEVAG